MRRGVGRPRVPVAQREPVLRELLLEAERQYRTHEVFCEAAGVTKSCVSRLRSGDLSTSVSLMTVNNMALALGLELALVKRKDAE